MQEQIYNYRYRYRIEIQNTDIELKRIIYEN